MAASGAGKLAANVGTPAVAGVAIAADADADAIADADADAADAATPASEWFCRSPG